MGKLTKESCTAPQRQVAVAVPSALTPEAPSEGRGMLADSAAMILTSMRSFMWMNDGKLAEGDEL